MFGLFFMGALYMERVLGYDPLQIGFAFLPATLVMGTLSLRYAEPLITRFGAKTTLLPGLVLIAVGLALFTRAPVDGNYVEHILPVMLVLATGIGVSFPALMTLAMSGATQEDAGLASGLVNTTAQVGGALGLAVLATLSTTRTDNLLAEGESEAQALVDGYHLAFWIGAALVVLALVIAVTVLKQEPTESEAEAEGEARGRASAGRSRLSCRVFAVLITGPPGAGKTAAITALCDALAGDQVPHAGADADEVAWAYPFPDLAGRCAHLRAWRESHARAGATLLVVAEVVESAGAPGRRAGRARRRRPPAGAARGRAGHVARAHHRPRARRLVRAGAPAERDGAAPRLHARARGRSPGAGHRACDRRGGRRGDPRRPPRVTATRRSRAPRR